MGGFARIADGRERRSGHESVPRHRHDQAYAAIILRGHYEECGSRGRFRVGPGDVLLHDRFDSHLNRFRSAGAEILNVVLPAPMRGIDIGRIDDPDAIVRIAERDPVDAAAALRERISDASPVPEDWTDHLARDLRDNPDCRLDDWARRHSLVPETLSRGFKKLFGVTPASFRMEARAGQAFALIADGDAPLAAIAAAAGFADQAHMSRVLLALTGSPPRAWRKSNPFKTEGRRLS